MKSYKFVVDNEWSGERLDRYISSKLSNELSRAHVQKIIKGGGVKLNNEGALVTKINLRKGDIIEINVEEEKKFEINAQNIPLEVIFEDSDILIINKRVGMVVHPAPGHSDGTVVNALMGSRKEIEDVGEATRPGIVHRIDRDTSGLLIVAKTSQSHANISKMFQERSIKKIYFALVQGNIPFEESLIEAPIGRHPRIRQKMSIRYDDKGKSALTEYSVIDRFKYSSYLKVRIITGRTHQIRVHFLHIGHPVLGDSLYGPKTSLKRLALHAGEIEFAHPVTGKTVNFKAPLPDDFNEILEHERKR